MFIVPLVINYTYNNSACDNFSTVVVYLVHTIYWQIFLPRNLQLSKSLKSASMDVSAEIRFARKKSRDKMKAFPDDDAVEEQDEKGESMMEPPTEGEGEGGSALERRVSHGTGWSYRINDL